MINKYNLCDEVIAKIDYADSSEEVKATIIGIEIESDTEKIKYKIRYNSDNISYTGYVYEDSIRYENSKYIIIWKCANELNDERVRIIHITAGSSQEAAEIFKKKLFNKLFQITIIAVEKLAL